MVEVVVEFAVPFGATVAATSLSSPSRTSTTVSIATSIMSPAPATDKDGISLASSSSSWTPAAAATAADARTTVSIAAPTPVVSSFFVGAAFFLIVFFFLVAAFFVGVAFFLIVVFFFLVVAFFLIVVLLINNEPLFPMACRLSSFADARAIGGETVETPKIVGNVAEAEAAVVECRADAVDDLRFGFFFFVVVCFSMTDVSPYLVRVRMVLDLFSCKACDVFSVAFLSGISNHVVVPAAFVSLSSALRG